MVFGLDNYFYHASMKRYISLFGSLFTDIHIKRTEDDKYIKVPLKFGTGNRYMKADQGESRETTKYARVVPAMMFELKTFYKDISRKTNPTNRISNSSFDLEGRKKYVYNRVPYNFIFELVILTKNLEDMFQITEQIIPAFDPNITVTIQDIGSVIDIEQDIVVNLQEIEIQDNYDEDSKRMIEHKITFELKGYLYKKDQVGYVIKESELIGYFNALEIGDQTFVVIDTINDQEPIQEEQYINSEQHNSIENSLFGSVAKL